MPPRPPSSSSDLRRHAALSLPRATAPRLHPLETALIAIVGSLLCFMPWALGTMHVWSQFISLGLAAFAFALALTHRHYRGDLAPQGDFSLKMGPKLFRFPLFWLGLALLGYIFLQAINPAWVYVQENRSWWMEPKSHLHWLPAGMDTPYKDMNAWRVLVIWGTAWLLVCALWVGITRRNAVTALFTIVIANGALWALIGLLQKITHTRYILWSLKDATTTSYFFGTILYKNHAGAYLNLVLMLAVALLFWHSQRAERRMARTSPAPLFGFCACVLGFAVLLSECKAATLLLGGFLAVLLLCLAIRPFLQGSSGRNPWVSAALALLLAGGLGVASQFINIKPALDRVNKLVDHGVSDQYRDLGRQATWDMAKANLVTGWGAGSFRHYFPVYQSNYPAIYTSPNNPKIKIRWEYTHNDYVQLLAELGLIGAAIIGGGLIWGLIHLVRKGAYRHFHFMIALGALGMTAMHAWVDFQFHNPAILVLWCVSFILLCRWTDLEAKHS